MNCQKCGNALKDGAKFCPKCGAKTDAAQPAPQQARPAQQASQQPVQQAQPQTQPAQQPQQAVQPADPNQPKKKKTWLLILLIVLLIAGLAVAAILYFKPFGNKGAKSWMVKVPDVVDTSYDDAADKLKVESLHGLIRDKVEDDSIEAESVVVQNPEAGSEACKGSIVDLTISAGKEMAFLPDVENFNLEDAEKLIKDAGFTISTKEEDDENAAPNSVKSQSIPSGYAEKGQEIVITVTPKKDAGTETVTVPNITGMDFADAKAELNKVGLYLSINVAQYSDTSPENQILEQDKTAGSQAKKGETVLVKISMGKEKVYVPDVTYRTEKKATEMLTNLGLTVKVKEEESKTVAKGTVISQDKTFNSYVEKGSEITITVSTGYEVEVPDVKGMKEQKAIDKLVESELAVNVVYKKDKDVKKGEVISQDIKAKEKVQIGTPVTIYVSANKDDGEDVSGKNVTEAGKDGGQSGGGQSGGGTVEPVKYINAEQKDFDNLIEILAEIGWYSDLDTDAFSEESFVFDSSNSKTAFDYAYYRMFPIINDGVFCTFDRIYGWNETYYNTDKAKGDPLGKFHDIAASYNIFDGEKVDMILQTFFNVTPSHDDYYRDNYKGVPTIVAYYYQGNYYFATGYGGDLSPTYSFDEKRQLPDGSYEMLLKLTSPVEPYETSNLYKVTAGINEVDGKRMWSLKKIELTTVEEFAAGAETKQETQQLP